MVRPDAIAACVLSLLSCNVPPSRGAPPAPARAAEVSAQAPAQTSPPQAEAPRIPNALYIGFARGPIVRIAEDGTTSELGEGRATALGSAPDGTVVAILSGQAYVLGETAERLGEGAPESLIAIAARAHNDVWAASRNRVAHFDGSSWSTVGDELFARAEIRDLTFDSSGVFWVLSADRLFRHANGAFAEVAAMEGSTLLRSFVRSPDGIDVMHYRGLDHFDGNAWSMIPLEWVERSRNGRLLFTSLTDAAYGGGVRAFTTRRQEIGLRVPDVSYLGDSSLSEFQLPATELNDVTVDEQGRAWFATNGGLLLLQRYGDPRIARWWRIHGFAALRRAPTHVLAVGRGPSVLPEVIEPPPSVVRGRVGTRYAQAAVMICSDPYHGEGGQLSCSMDGLRWEGVADARGRFEITGVAPGGYEVFVRSGSSWRETIADCCAASTPGAAVELGELYVMR